MAYFSAIGLYYPDGSETKRKSIRINVSITPTTKGINEGRDEVPEKAIAIIEGE